MRICQPIRSVNFDVLQCIASGEPEQAYSRSGARHALRLRPVHPLVSTSKEGVVSAQDALITGGLGGLGLRAATLLRSNGANRRSF